MEIYLMRHAEAMSAAEWRKPDVDRPLTKSGIAKLDEGLKEMKRVGFSVPLIVTSPYLRALETARRVSQSLNLPEPVVKNELSSGTHHRVLYKVASELISQTAVLFVCHMPEIAIFGTRLTNEPRVMDQGLQPADILAVDMNGFAEEFGEGKIRWWRKIDEWKQVQA